MKTEYRQNLKTDQFGQVDVNYYIAKGKQLRSEAIGGMLKRLFARLRSGCAKKTHHLPLNVNFRH